MSTTLQVGSEAPEFALQTPAGDGWRLDEHLPVALFFFRGMWWPNCRKQLVQLREAFREFAQLGVAVAGVVGQAPAKVGEYLAGHPLPFPLLPDPERDVIKAYGVYHFIGIDAFNIARPSVFLIDRERLVRYLYVAANQVDRPDPKELLVESANLG